jgi:DNA primase
MYHSSQQDATLQEETYGHPINSNIGLTSAQLHFLHILSHIKTDETLKELKRLVRDFYAQQLQKEADKYWEEGKIGDHLLNEHLRTPYK